jgi:hypothetical protein
LSDPSEPLDPNAPQDREHFGEASLGEAQSETNPDPLDEGREAPDSAEELTDVPALEPAPTDTTLSEAEEEAAAEAGAIGGRTGEEGIPEAERPLAEAGEGEAEGFELAEEQLIESASHGDPSGNPLGDRFTPEDGGSEGLAEYGEADEEHVSEDTSDDH